MTFEPGLVVRTRVKSDHVDDFERWVTDVVATLTERGADVPEIQWFREWAVMDTAPDAVDYIILAAGSDLSALDLEPLLTQSYGPEEAQTQLARFEAMLHEEQDAWSVQPIES